MEPVSLVIGAGLVLVGFVLGRAQRRNLTAPVDTKCPGCGHSLSYRDPETGRCTASVERESQYDEYGSPVAYQWVPCQCHNHVSADQLMIDAAWKPQLAHKPEHPTRPPTDET